MGNPAKPLGKAAVSGPLQAVVSTVATTQILRASGYSAAEPTALRALSDIAGRYIASLGHTAVAFAEARGRTEPNVADVILALEEHTQCGFPGASDPTSPVLSSGALAEVARFVATVREVPFVKPMPKREASSRKRWESFAAAGEEPPLRHVPLWLPRFPTGWEKDHQMRSRNGKAEAKGEEEDTGEVVTVIPANGNSGNISRGGAVPEKREKVSFSVPVNKRR